MLGTAHLSIFVAAGLLLNVTPGADTLFIVSRAGSLGTRAGVYASLGIGAGCLVHVGAAALGISAVLAASATAFSIVKAIGALYLIYLGLSLLLGGGKKPGRAIVGSAIPRQIFWQGFLTNALNPKVALFFLAFLPQFVAADAPSKSLALLFLGVLFDCNGTLWNLLVAWTAGSIAGRVGHRAAAATAWLRRVVGGVFVGLGIRLAAVQA